MSEDETVIVHRFIACELLKRDYVDIRRVMFHLGLKMRQVVHAMNNDEVCSAIHSEQSNYIDVFAPTPAGEALLRGECVLLSTLQSLRERFGFRPIPPVEVNKMFGNQCCMELYSLGAFDGAYDNGLVFWMSTLGDERRCCLSSTRYDAVVDELRVLQRCRYRQLSDILERQLRGEPVARRAAQIPRLVLKIGDQRRILLFTRGPAFKDFCERIGVRAVVDDPASAVSNGVHSATGMSTEETHAIPAPPDQTAWSDEF